MLVSGVFSSCAARERKRSLRDSRSAAANTAAARVSSGRSGRRSRTPLRKWRERAPTMCSWRQSGTAAESSPHSTRPVSTPSAASSGEHGSPSQPSICRPAAVRRWTATPAAPDNRRAILAILPASSRVFSPASAASASCVAAPEERNALSTRRCSEKTPERKRRARSCRALWTDPRTSRAPSRRNPRAVPARACCTRVCSLVERAFGAGRRTHADQNGSRCARPIGRETGNSGRIGPRQDGTAAAGGLPKVHFRTHRGDVPAAFTLGVWLLATPAADPEPGLLETQEAAARAAGGSSAQDASRLARARAAHWAPQLRGQATARDDEKTRNGEYRLAPLHEQNVAVGHAWMLTLTWDLSQVIFAREETQLALAHLQLARVRRDAADRAAQLWIERRQAQALWIAARTREPCFALLRATAGLVALTGGLFRDAAAREEAACAGDRR